MPLFPPIDAAPAAVTAALRPLRNDFSVALWSPGNPFAVGAVIRVAHNFLAREILVVGEAPFYRKASMGMHKYETIRLVKDEEDLLVAVEGRPLWVVEKEAARRSLYTVQTFPRDVVFVFGSERFGVPASLLARADEVLAIPTYGVNQSLPLAVAAGIVMSDWARRRYGSGALF